MRQSKSPVLVAIAGGSGSGKTWLADELAKQMDGNAGRISLDDFYWDRSDLPSTDRAALNFDHPEAIEWPLFEEVLAACASGQSVSVPRYDFVTHSRLVDSEPVAAHPIVFVDGLWLLHHPSTSRIFHLSIYLDCPQNIRLQRRLNRDVAYRGRNAARSRQVFEESVVPMHCRFVDPQKRQADLVQGYPLSEADIQRLKENIMKLYVPEMAQQSDQKLVLEKL